MKKNKTQTEEKQAEPRSTRSRTPKKEAEKIATPISKSKSKPKTEKAKRVELPPLLANQSDEVPTLLLPINLNPTQIDNNIPHYEEYRLVPNCSNLCKFEGEYFNTTLNCINQKNSKFFLLQIISLISKPNEYYNWNRWGKIGSTGQNNLSGPFGLMQAINFFMKKINDKTKAEYVLAINQTTQSNKQTIGKIMNQVNQEIKESINRESKNRILKLKMKGFDSGVFIEPKTYYVIPKTMCQIMPEETYMNREVIKFDAYIHDQIVDMLAY